MSNDAASLGRLRDYYAAHQVLPSYATLGGLAGLRSKASVAALVARLKLQGFLASTPEKRLKPGRRFFERILVDSVRAGVPEAADDSAAETITIDTFLIERPSQTVLVKVKGDSMIDAGIRSGDIAVVERRPAANIGDIVVAIVDDEFTIKYLDRQRNEFVLRPANPAYPIIRAQINLEIFGVVVGLIRKY
jgi:repressor LexA